MRPWRWAAARSLGTSHERAGTECQDRFFCLSHPAPEGDVLLAVVADGAGSAPLSAHGARVVCAAFHKAVVDHFRDGGLVDDVDGEAASAWVVSIRERLERFARREGLEAKACASTLVAVLAGPISTRVVHVGDGAAVIRRRDGDGWEVPSWPYNGEYANSTRFVTDLPAPRVVVTALDDPVDHVAVFTDGLDRLVLRHADRRPFDPFFDRMFPAVERSEAAGRDARLSEGLRSYLAGPAVCDRTDDDKTLILAAR